MRIAWPVTIVQRDPVGSRIMQRGDKQRIVRDGDAPLDQRFANRRIVEYLRQQPRVHLPRVAATGTAVQAARMRIVDHVGTVTSQQDDRRKPIDQRHCPQHGFRRIDPRFGHEVGIEARGGIIASRGRGHAQSVAHGHCTASFSPTHKRSGACAISHVIAACASQRHGLRQCWHLTREPRAGAVNHQIPRPRIRRIEAAAPNAGVPAGPL